MNLGGVQRTRRRTFVQLFLNFLCELCAFAREKPFTSSPADSAWEDVVVVSRKAQTPAAPGSIDHETGRGPENSPANIRAVAFEFPLRALRLSGNLEFRGRKLKILLFRLFQTGR